MTQASDEEAPLMCPLCESTSDVKNRCCPPCNLCDECTAKIDPWVCPYCRKTRTASEPSRLTACGILLAFLLVCTMATLPSSASITAATRVAVYGMYILIGCLVVRYIPHTRATQVVTVMSLAFCVLPFFIPERVALIATTVAYFCYWLLFVTCMQLRVHS